MVTVLAAIGTIMVQLTGKNRRDKRTRDLPALIDGIDGDTGHRHYKHDDGASLVQLYLQNKEVGNRAARLFLLALVCLSSFNKGIEIVTKDTVFAPNIQRHKLT
jgi:hypothetical protein